MTNQTINTGGITGDQLRSFMERVERLEEEKSKVLGFIRDVYAEAKSEGFDPKIMRTLVRLRKMDKSELSEQQELLDLYMHALGMVIAE